MYEIENLNDCITMEDLIKTIDEIRNTPFPKRPPTIYSGGSGLADDIVVDYFKDISIYVVTRDGRYWFRGKQVEFVEYEKGGTDEELHNLRPRNL